LSLVRIGVGLTYYNEGPLLTECLESLAQGEDRPDEILIYDDASQIPPGPYIPVGIPVQVIRGEVNRGPACGRNALLEACSCDYLHFHDSDDLFRPEWCREVRALLEKNPVDAVLTEVSSFCDGEVVAERVLDLQSLVRDPDLVRFCIRRALLVPAGTHHRAKILAMGGYSTEFWQSEDFEFHLRLALSGVRFEVIDRPLVRIRIHEGSRSRDRVRVWVDGARALETLAAKAGASYTQDFCDALAKVGANLYQLGAYNEARRVYASAYRLGRPRFPGQSRLYRILALVCGAIAAEFVGRVYRGLLPAAIRKQFRSGE
jgi:glycosyltransferase involved in cell wall biosynthesis